jgi:stage III sporulation protein AE
MGGNVRAAAVNHSVMSAFLTLLETFCAASVLPIAGICLALALLDALNGGIDLRPLAALIKRTYVLALSFVMLLLCGVLGLQSTLAKAGDSLALRTAGFAAGSFLPVVGGSISQTLGTVAGSISYLRAVAGTGAILVLFFTFLPTFLSILLTRIAFLLGGSVAKLLGADGEEKILAEFGAVWGYFLAVIAALFVMLTFSLTLFARSAVPNAIINLRPRSRFPSFRRNVRPYALKTDRSPAAFSRFSADPPAIPG